MNKNYRCDKKLKTPYMGVVPSQYNPENKMLKLPNELKT